MNSRRTHKAMVMAVIMAWTMPASASPKLHPAPRSLWQLSQDLKAAGYPVAYQVVQPPTKEAVWTREGDDLRCEPMRKAIGNWWVIGPGLHFEARQYKEIADAINYCNNTGRNSIAIGNWALEGIDYDQLKIIRRVYTIDDYTLVDPFGRYYFLDLPFKAGFAKLWRLVKEAEITLAMGEERKYVFKDGTLTFSFPNASGSDYAFEKRNMGLPEALEIGKLLAKGYAKYIDFDHPTMTKSTTDPSGSISYKAPPDPESDAEAEIVIRTFEQEAVQVEFKQQDP